jgi:hypothetical protein
MDGELFEVSVCTEVRAPLRHLQRLSPGEVQRMFEAFSLEREVRNDVLELSEQEENRRVPIQSGDLFLMETISMLTLVRFFRFANVKDGCWEWSGAITNYGYGSQTVNKKTFRAHRLSLMIHGRNIRDAYVLHHCDNRKCVNPEHLYLGDALDNARDRVARKRWFREPKTHCLHGHSLEGENLYISPKSKQRCCRTCRSARSKKFYERNKKRGT